MIKDQAGTLWKAILEGLMNLVDAGATEASLEITRKKVILDDNGRGFTSEEEIDSNFAVFGMPQTEVEKLQKKYGKYRMGRGQMFAFGVNSWRTGEFQMDVDINKPPPPESPYSLNFQQTSGLEHRQGCRVEIQLYQSLSNTAHAELLKTVERVARYISIPITLNGEIFTVDPAEAKWDFETDEAYIKFRANGELSIYNQGVLIMELAHWRLGCGGEVVCKIAPMVNFARNDIKDVCPVWKAVKKKVNREATRRNTSKPRLDDGARERLATQIVDGELKDFEARKVKIFTDVTGKHWKLRQLTGFSQKVSNAPMYSSIGDKLMQRKLGIVLADDTLERFGLELGPLVELMNKQLEDYHSKFQAIDFEVLSEGMDEYHELVPEVDWKPDEQLVLQLLDSAQVYLLHNAPPDMGTVRRRTLTIGESDADGWTDGRSYICIARDFIKKTGILAAAWPAYAHLLIHEYCHDVCSAGSHIHSDEFYRHYHDWTSNYRAIPGFFGHCLHQLPNRAATIERRLNKRQLKNQDKIEAAQRAAEALAAKSHEIQT